MSTEKLSSCNTWWNMNTNSAQRRVDIKVKKTFLCGHHNNRTHQNHNSIFPTPGWGYKTSNQKSWSLNYSTASVFLGLLFSGCLYSGGWRGNCHSVMPIMINYAKIAYLTVIPHRGISCWKICEQGVIWRWKCDILSLSSHAVFILNSWHRRKWIEILFRIIKQSLNPGNIKVIYFRDSE